MGFVKPSVAPIASILGASLVLAACATLPPPEYPSNHPANPAAPGCGCCAELERAENLQVVL